MALNIQSEIYLDVQQRNIQKTITAHQYDKNSRYILAHIIDDGEPLDISDYDIMFKVLTQDNRAILIDTCEKQNTTGDVIISLSESLLCSSGKHMAEVIIYDDTTLLSTMKFTLVTEASVFPDERLISSDDFSAITRIIENADIARNIIDTLDALQDDIQDTKDEMDGYLASIQALQSDVQDNIDESDAKLANLETTTAAKIQELDDKADEIDDLIASITSDTQQLQNDLSTVDDLIAQVSGIVVDDSAVRKTQLGIASTDYVDGVATLDSNAKLKKIQFPYELMTNDDIDAFIRDYNGLQTVTIDNVVQERNIDFVTADDVDYGDVYIIVG